MQLLLSNGLVSRLVKFSIALLLFVGTTSLSAQNEEPPKGTSQICCEDNVVRNGHFEDGLDPGSGQSFSGCTPGVPYPLDWCAIYSPQYRGSAGFNQTYGVVAGRCVQMWGITTWTQNHGEAIWQETSLTAGVTYALRFDARFRDVGNLGPDTVIVRFRAYNSPPTSVNPPGGTLIGEVMVSDIDYNTYYIPAWYAIQNYSFLLVSVHNTTPSDQNGSYNSWGLVDNICMQRVQAYQNPIGKKPNPDMGDLPELYPNPTNGHVTVDYPESYGAVKSVTIMDQTGREWPAQRLESKTGQLEFDAATFANGLYYIRVEFEQSEFPYTAQFRKN